MNPSYNGGVADNTITPVKLSAGGPEWNTTGYFGVGTSGTVDAPLHVVGDAGQIAKLETTVSDAGSVAINADFSQAYTLTGGDDYIGKIKFTADGHDGANVAPFGEIGSVIVSDTIDAEKSDLVFSTVTGGTTNQALRLSHGGLVGVGGFTPIDESARLTVSDAGAASYTRPALLIDAFEPDIKLIDTEGGTAGGQIKMKDGNMTFRVSTQTDIATDLTEHMTITDDGYIGAGTTDPKTVLHVDNGPFQADIAAANKTIVLSCLDEDGEIGAVGSSLAFARIGSSAPRTAIAIKQNTVDRDQCGLTFWTHPSGESSDPLVEAMAITYQGYVGIGESDPSALLHLTGDSIAESWYQTTGAGGATWRVGVGSSESGFAGEYRIYDETNAAARLLIDESGFVGINTVNPTKSLDVNGDAQATNLYTNTVYFENLERVTSLLTVSLVLTLHRV